MQRSITKGLVSGIVVSLIIATSVLFAVHSTQAQAPFAGSQTIWKGLNSGSNLTFGNGDNSNATASPTGSTDTRTPTPLASAFAAPTARPGSSSTYAALGDSVAAGLGLPTGNAVTTTDVQCGRSSQAYAYAVAVQQSMQLLHVACSGATAGDLVTKQAVDGPNIQSQLDQAFAAGTPGLISITAGANDIKWSQQINACYVTNCATATNTTLVSTALNIMQAKLYLALFDIQTRSGGNPPTVVVTGYYSPISPQCTSLLPALTTQEITWVQNRVADLNQAIQDTVQSFDFARYATVDFNGHDLCSADPWVQGPSDPAPIHPTAAGQAAIARSVEAVL